MQLSAVLAAVLASSTIVLALDPLFKPQAVFRSIQRLFEADGKSVGESWALCDNPESHLLRANKVEILPAQPVIGQDITVILDADAIKQIPGGRISIQLKLGLIKFTKQFDLCQALSDISETRCPINQGPVVIKTTQNIPKELPPLPVKGTVRVVDETGALVTCVELDIKLIRQ